MDLPRVPENLEVRVDRNASDMGGTRLVRDFQYLHAISDRALVDRALAKLLLGVGP